MKLKPSFYFCLFALFALASCKKGSNVKSSVKALDPSVDINVLGNSLSKGAVVWSNGIETPLPGLPNKNFTVAVSMVVNGTDLYVTGYAGTSALDQNAALVYWKNGVIAQIPGNRTSTYITGIAVSGTDVYVSGYTYPTNQSGAQAVYWKNGAINFIQPGSNSTTDGITISGTDIYILGTIANPNRTACYWKNGVVYPITDGTQDIFPQSIAVQNNHVYVLSNEYRATEPISMLWVDGIATQLPTSTGVANQPSEMVVNGNEVYVTGENFISNNNPVPVLWKNNVLQTFPGVTAAGSAGPIAVFGNDIYVAGLSNAEGFVLWKNGVVAAKFGADWDTNQRAGGIPIGIAVSQH